MEKMNELGKFEMRMISGGETAPQWQGCIQGWVNCDCYIDFNTSYNGHMSVVNIGKFPDNYKVSDSYTPIADSGR